MVKTKVMDVTPRMASSWLKKNKSNRPLSEALAKKYADAQVRDEWEFTADTVKFDTNDILLDGQHRLRAIELSGIPMKVMVVWGLDPKVFSAIDLGKKRTAGDVLAVCGEKNYTTLASATITVWKLLSGNVKSMGYPSQEQVLTTLNDHPGLRQSVAQVNALRGRSTHMPASMAAAFHYLFSTKDAEKADKFWKGVYDGEGLTKGSPIYRLRERLILNFRSRSKMRREYLMHLCIKAWKLYLAGTANLSRLQVAEGEVFPPLLDYIGDGGKEVA
jgi:hypothetical protein